MVDVDIVVEPWLRSPHTRLHKPGEAAKLPRGAVTLIE